MTIAEVRQLINDVIKENYNREITADILNNVLQQMLTIVELNQVTPELIKQLYEQNDNTNAFTDAEKDKLESLVSGKKQAYLTITENGQTLFDIAALAIIQAALTEIVTENITLHYGTENDFHIEGTNLLFHSYFSFEVGERLLIKYI